MKRPLNPRGITFLPVLVMLVVIVAVALIAVRVSDRGNGSASTAVSSSQKTQPPAKSPQDLQKASDSLDNAELNTAVLDGDVSGLL